MRSRKRAAAGFTLIELLVSFGIMTVILSTVIFRFSAFDSVILLKTLSYNIALTIREAQTYSLSTYGSSSNFRVPYGVSFIEDRDNFTLFSYSGPDSRPRFDSSASALDIISLGRSYQILDICVVVGGSEDCSVSELDISFRRPEFTAIFFVDGFTEGQNGAIESGIIKVGLTDGEYVGRVEVGLSGYIVAELE